MEGKLSTTPHLSKVVKLIMNKYKIRTNIIVGASILFFTNALRKLQ